MFIPCCLRSGREASKSLKSNGDFGDPGHVSLQVEDDSRVAPRRRHAEVLENKHLSRVPRADHPSNNSSTRNSDSEAYIDDSDIGIERALRHVEDSDIDVKVDTDATRRDKKQIPRVGSEDPGPNGT